MYLEIVNVSDTVVLQGALDLINEWASTWQLQLSVSKCNMLTIGHVPFDVKYSVYDTVLHMSLLARTWVLSLHMISLCQSTLAKLPLKHINVYNYILRTFVSKDIKLLMRAFIVYVCPIVEYCSVVWSPNLKKGYWTNWESPTSFHKKTARTQTHVIQWKTALSWIVESTFAFGSDILL